jgi:hypothetical protein
MERSPTFVWQHVKPVIHYNNRQYEAFYNGWERSRNGSMHSFLQACREKVEILPAH